MISVVAREEPEASPFGSGVADTIGERSDKGGRGGYAAHSNDQGLVGRLGIATAAHGEPDGLPDAPLANQPRKSPPSCFRNESSARPLPWLVKDPFRSKDYDARVEILALSQQDGKAPCPPVDKRRYR